MIVHLKSSNPHYPDLSASQPYFVIGIEADDLRILNDRGKPYLYPADLFEVIDSKRPPDWVTEFGTDGEEYSYPVSLNQPGFFEDFFDQQPAQTSTFWHVLNQTLAKAA
ncbi:type 2 periplasmic-binding domain-containing protein [Lamprocystis purpurea]|jgi:hypothetical protein|uniref:hypothetical protein n=1 Tax=Lamprocystis purpurea TaxID=61598 RepID=UPI0012F75A4D|nr:hypothetical protein [Lamprocystis purpurea]